MKRRNFILGVALVATSATLSSCGYRVDTFRYRMTVEVETPQGLRVGSAVREVRYTVPPKYPSIGESRPQWSVKGEAVAVGLPGGKVLFALLVGEGHNNLQPHLGIVTLMREKGMRMARPIEIWPAMPTTSAPKFQSLMPMLVTFGDVNDPTSVELVEADDLAASFGEGVSLRRVFVEKTSDPVTTGIEKRLAWLSEYTERRLDPKYRGSTNPNLAQLLWHWDFRRGNAQ